MNLKDSLNLVMGSHHKIEDTQENDKSGQGASSDPSMDALATMLKNMTPPPADQS